MADGPFTLSEADRDKIMEALSWIKGRRFNTPQHGSLTPSASDSQSPEVYVVKTLGEGIPALELGGSYDIPGKATCDIYRIDSDDNLVGILYDQEVYNISLSALPADTYILGIRDKHGNWIGVDTSSSGGSGSATQIVQVTSLTMSGDYFPGKVRLRSGGVWADGADCWVLDANGENLPGLNRQGPAVKVDTDGGKDVYAYGIIDDIGACT